MANIVVLIRKTHADVLPARSARRRDRIAFAVQRQRRGQAHREGLAHVARIQLRVHIKGERRLVVSRCTADSRHAVIFLVVDGGDGESVFEELRI